MEHGSAADGSDMVPVGADNVLGAVPDASGIIRSQRTAHAANTIDRLGYVDGTISDKRYVRLRADFNGTHGTGTPISAVAILSKGRQTPIA